MSLTWLGAHANWRGEFSRAIETSRGRHGGARDQRRLQRADLARLRLPRQIGLGEYPEALATIDDGLAKARDRNNSFIVGRLTNTLGWLYQELGDFRRATEYDREARSIGQPDQELATWRSARSSTSASTTCTWATRGAPWP